MSSNCSFAPLGHVDGHLVKGCNFSDKTEHAFLCALQAPRFNIVGVRPADLKPLLPQLSVASIGRYLKRLRLLFIIKKITGLYRYYLTRLGRTTIAAACRLSEQCIIPTLAR